MCTDLWRFRRTIILTAPILCMVGGGIIERKAVEGHVCAIGLIPSFIYHYFIVDLKRMLLRIRWF